MIVTRRIALRIALILLVGVILQVSFFSYLTFAGVSPDVLSVIVAILGLMGGAVVGGVAGFGAGFLLDCVLLQTLGVSSLVLMSVGYLAGRYREGFEIGNSLIPPLLVGGLTLLGAAEMAAIQLMLGVDVPVSLLVLREIVMKGILAAILALPGYPLMRMLLRAALLDERPSRGLAAALTPGRSRRLRRSAARRVAASRRAVGGGVA
jgi:rod shape-determining protein MreD